MISLRVFTEGKIVVFSRGFRSRNADWADPIGLNNLRFTDAAHFMWSSDYPHGAATWPNSAATVKAEFDEFGVPEEQRVRLTLTNVAELYGIDIDAVREPSPKL